jgi:putative spermidine/putrescine transport system permease protein
VASRRIVFGICVVLAYLVLLLPLAVVIGGSFDGSASAYLKFPPEHLSLRWYVDLPAKYLQAFGRSLIIASTAAAMAMIIGIVAAFGIARGSLRHTTLVETLFRLPVQIPFVVTGVVFLQFYYILFDATGLQLLGSYPGLILAHLFFCLPYTVAAIGSVITPRLENIENAARVAGASESRVFRRVTLPAIMPGVFSGLFFSFILSFGDVPVTVFLSTGSKQPLSVEIFQTLQFDYDPAVLSVSTLVVIFSVALITIMRWVAGIDLILRAGANK